MPSSAVVAPQVQVQAIAQHANAAVGSLTQDVSLQRTQRRTPAALNLDAGSGLSCGTAAGSLLPYLILTWRWRCSPRCCTLQGRRLLGPPRRRLMCIRPHLTHSADGSSRHAPCTREPAHVVAAVHRCHCSVSWSTRPGGSPTPPADAVQMGGWEDSCQWHGCTTPSR